MNLSRLMVLGLLATEGPMHGHQIRRTAEQTSVESWGGVNVGALYRELHRMEDEGLVESVGTEQVGRRPTRTVYSITEAGRQNLVTLRAEAFRGEEGYLDAVGVALQFGGPGEPGELAELLAYRQRVLEAHLSQLVAERQRFGDKLAPASIAVYRRGELRLAAEIEWHTEARQLLRDTVPGLQPEQPDQPSDQAAGQPDQAETASVSPLKRRERRSIG